MKHLAAAAAAFSLALGAAGSANAVLMVNFDSVNDTSGVINFDGFGGAGPVAIPGLRGQVTYTLTGISGLDWTFRYNITNTSIAPITQSRISMIGFNVQPDVLQPPPGTPGVDPIGISVFTDDAQNGNVPNFGVAEVCLSGSNCAGGGGEGVNLTPINTGQGFFVLHFPTNADFGVPASVTLSNFVIRYQAITGSPILDEQGNPVSSAIGRPCQDLPGGVCPGPGQQNFVPEPATWAMMITGFGLAGAMLRRRRAFARAA